MDTEKVVCVNGFPFCAISGHLTTSSSSSQFSAQRKTREILAEAAVQNRAMNQAMLGETGAPGASIWGTVFNLANNIIGAGFLALPCCVKQSSMEVSWLL